MDPGQPAGADPTGGPAGQDMLGFLPALQALWSARQPQQFKEEAWRGFAALDDPHTALLDLLEARTAPWRKGPSLEAWLVRELERWLQARPPLGPSQGGPGLGPLQARAARLLADSPPSLVEPLVRIFQLQDTDRGSLLALVHQLHQEGKFKEAVMLGTKLRLQPELDLDMVSVPLLLQDQLGLLERYVEGFPGLQRRLLALLDSWCRPGFDVGVVARRYPQAAPQALEKLRPRVLTRQVLRLQNRFGLDPASCPHAVAQQRLAALRYLCYKRFVEGSMSQEDWTDFVRGLVGSSEWLQGRLLRLLASRTDAATVARCALDLSLPEEWLPATGATELRRLRLQGRPAEAPSQDTTGRYYQLPIARKDVHLLASWEELARHGAELLQPGQVVALDLEWRPSFGAWDRPPASLLQLAVRGRVLLLDLLTLSQPGGQASRALSGLVSGLLSDPSITKLGYGMAGDLKRLAASCPALALAPQQLQGGLDLQLVHGQIREADGPAPGKDRAPEPRGLSLLVQQVLGRPLDKAQQLSNWDRRPLAEGQLLYAAADAYCLLEVYWALCSEPARVHLVGDLARSPEPPGPQEAAAPPQQVLEAEAGAQAPEIPVRAFRVVCDSMLQGLARSLRLLGADVLALGSGEDHRRAAEVARQEGRIILTSGLPYHTLRSQVGDGRCLRVDCSLKAAQQAKAVLRRFNVRVSPSDIFSRCQACNCDQYLKVSKGLMTQLVGLSGQEDPSSAGDQAQSQDTQEPGSAPGETPGLTYDPPCRWLEAAELQASAPATLGNGTRLQLAGVPAGVLRRPGLRHFFCCSGCGKVFWEGSHLGRMASQFQDVLARPPGPPQPGPPAPGPPEGARPDRQ
ncbi:unnamed protein product [Pipistrellus nathusii]|uniref:Exonuclease mut-7 homolog n=1 Tax=Pipistrellus nathusii TaxID=59473 RepID=A0ABN9Z514_PIPNA